MIITIDGPAGSGKSSVSRALAKKLKFIHLNSGLLYRAVYYICNQEKISLEDKSSVTDNLNGFEFDFKLDMVDFHTEIRVFFRPKNQELDISLLLSDLCSQGASLVGVLPYVRDYLTDYQRRMGVTNNMVLEGRDAGSVVFPDADYKFYIDASLEERVRRRFAQEIGLEFINDSERVNKILTEMKERDDRDRLRSIAPQIIPDGAIVVDTTSLNLSEVVLKLYQQIRL